MLARAWADVLRNAVADLELDVEYTAQKWIDEIDCNEDDWEGYLSWAGNIANVEGFEEYLKQLENGARK